MIILHRQLVMLHLIMLHILCFVPGNAFPQRNKPNSESYFDFDAYLGHFASMKQDVNEHPRFIPNQDYRYIPLLGERPDYIPPILHRGHIPHSNIPKRELKHRAWHSKYQSSNIPTPAIEQAKKSIHTQNTMQTHKRELHQPITDISTPTSNFNFRLHPKIEDFGDYDAPVVIESIVKKEIPTFRQHSDDYDIPVVLESIVKKRPASIEQNRKPIAAVTPIEMQVAKGFDSKKPIFTEPSSDDYDLPVVIDALIKKENPITNTPNRKAVIKTTEIYHFSIPEDYDEPIVLEALTKVDPQIPNKRDGHNKPTKTRPVVNHHGHANLIAKPVDKLVSPSYQKDYEAPIIVEAFPKKEFVHVKAHDIQLVKEKPLEKHDPTNPIVKPVKKTASRYSEDYESPIVLGAFIKESRPHFVHTKEHGHKGEEKPVTKEHNEKVVIANLSENSIRTGYIEDEYEVPIVLEALTKEELFHKEHGKKKSVMKPNKLEANKGSKQVVSSTEESITEEYRYEELEHFTIHGEDEYDFPVIVGNKMHRDSEDYDYEDSVRAEDLTLKGKQISKEHDQRSEIVKPSMKTSPEIMNENYKKNYVSSISQGTSKQITKFPVTKETKKRIVKREVKVDYEDYDLPIVLESIVKQPTVSKEHGIETSDEIKLSYDQDYEAPIILESIVKGNNPVIQKHTRTKPASVDKPKIKHPIDYYDYEEPVVLESIVKKSPGIATSHKPAFEGPTDYSYGYKLPAVVETHIKKFGTSDHELETVDLPSKIKPQVDPEDYDLPILIDSFTKEGVKVKPAVQSDVKKTPNPVTNTVEAKPVDAYIRNKREREQHVEYPKLVNSISPDAYERPIDETAKHGYEFNDPQGPYNYFDEWESVPKENPDTRHFESLSVPDNQIVLDSITINRENPEGREIPFLEVLSIEDKADGGGETGVKVMAFNQENGDVDSFNLGHVDSNHEFGELGDQGSGSVIDERSVSRSFLPLDSNSWSFMNHIQAQERRKFKRCFTPRNQTGNCMPVQMCPVPNAGNTVDDFLKNVCIIDEVFIGICCPEFPVETVRVDWGQFGGPDTEPLIDNVEESQETKECGKLSPIFGDKDSWPWMAHLVSSTSDKVFCGGALVTEHYVLTAAHCTSRIPRNQILVRLGNLDFRQTSSDFAVIEIKRHAQYNPRTMQNDIALLKLSRRVPLGNFRKLICLPESEEEDNVGETAMLLRWQGITEKGAVESLPVISNNDCQNRLGTIIGGSVLCTDARNDEAMCNADSGAPLVISKDETFKIIGVLTWNRNDCDRYPAVFTRISSYRKWIRTHTA